MILARVKIPQRLKPVVTYSGLLECFSRNIYQIDSTVVQLSTYFCKFLGCRAFMQSVPLLRHIPSHTPRKQPLVGIL